MELEDLRVKQANFEVNRQDLRKEYGKLEKIRKKFVSNFPPEKIGELSIEKYVVGKEDSFCYWLETKLMDLGKITGGRATADKKFGIYFGKTKYNLSKRYRFIKKKFGSTEKEVYSNIQDEITTLLRVGEQGDTRKIIDNKLSPMFKGKILSTYYPNNYLNIFANEHLNYFLEKLDLISGNTYKLNEIEKRDMLLQFKNNDSVMKDWSIFEFSHFLYDQFGRPPKKDQTSKELREYIDFREDYSDPKKIKSDFIDLKINSGKIEIISQRRKTERTLKIIDIEKENRRHKMW